MAPSSRTRSSAIPAWPALVAVQATLLVSFLVVGALRATPRALRRPPSIEEQLRALDLPASEAAVQQALAAARSPAAVAAGDLERAAAGLTRLSEAAGLSVSAVTWGAPEPLGALVERPVTLELRGDPYDLPALLGLLVAAPLDVQVRRLDVMSAGGAGVSVRLELAVSHPSLPPADWVEARLERATSGAAAAGPVLQQAAELSSWRHYNAAVAQRIAARDAALAEGLRSLSPALIRLRTEGGRLQWSPGAPPALQ